MIILLLILFTFSVLLLLRMFWESFQYQISRRTAALSKKLPRPLRILHLSDIHFRGNDKRTGLFFEELSREAYDFIFVTGDIFDCPEGITGASLFRKLKARYGIYAVFGNHDYYNYQFWDMFLHYSPGQGKPHKPQPTDLFEKALREAGVRLLRNETEEVVVDGVSLLIHGLDDPITGRASMREGLLNFNAQKINILLAHTIDVFLDIREGEIDLSFSGHSHGGQVCFPGVGPVLTHTHLGRQYADGLKPLKGAVCSISRGVGTSRFYQIRLLCAPEAIALEVTSSFPDKS